MSEGKKFDSGKPPLHLVSWPAIWEIAKVLEFGAQKYNAWDWQKGINHSRTLSAALRHLTAYVTGETYDDETGINHLAHALCEIMFALTFDLQGRDEFDDRFSVSNDMYGVYHGDRVDKYWQKIDGNCHDLSPNPLKT